MYHSEFWFQVNFQGMPEEEIVDLADEQLVSKTPQVIKIFYHGPLLVSASCLCKGQLPKKS